MNGKRAVRLEIIISKPNVNARDIDIIITNVYKRDIMPAKSEANENRLRFALSMFPGP